MNKKSKLYRSILESASFLANEIGVHNVTFYNLGSALNRSPYSLYHHFSSVEEMRDEIVRYSLDNKLYGNVINYILSNKIDINEIDVLKKEQIVTFLIDKLT